MVLIYRDASTSLSMTEHSIEVARHFKAKIQARQGKQNATDRRVRLYVTIGGVDV